MRQAGHPWISFLWTAVLAVACAPDARIPAWLETPQIILTEAASSVYSASLSATITSSGNLTGCGFSVTDAEGRVTDYDCDLSGEGFTRLIQGLTPDSDYRFSAYVANGSYRLSSREKSFHTAPSPVLSLSKAEAGPFSIALNGRFSSGTMPEDAGISLSVKGRDTWEDHTCFDASRASLSFRIEGLVPETDYLLRPWFQLEGKRFDLDLLPVRTLPEPDDRITSTGVKADVFSAAFTATLSRLEGLTGCGFGWATKDGEFTERSVSPEGAEFRLSVDGLQSDTEYRYYAWAEAYGRRFQTTPAPFSTLMRPFEDIQVLSLEVTPERTGATLTAILSAPDGITDCGFGVSRNGRDFIEYGAVLEGSSFHATVQGLQPETDYSCYAFFFYENRMIQTPYQTFRTL